MKAKHLLRIFSILFFLCPVFSFAQMIQQDTAFLSSSINKTKKVYTQTIQGQARLYNGSDYIEYKSVGDEHPYFLIDDWVMSTVEYAGEYFENVPIFYDISSDKVITENYYTSNKMQLVSELIGSFTFQNRLFVRIIENSTNGINLNNRFYDVLYSGKLRVYAKHAKALQRRIQSDALVVSFDEINRYYINKNNTFYEVGSKSSVLSVLSDKKKELKKFLKDNHLKFKTNKEKSLVATAKYYDMITQ